MLAIFLVFLVLLPSIGQAAYQNPTIVQRDLQTNGSLYITFSFSGNAGEPTVRRVFVVTQSTTATSLRNWIDDNLQELDLIFTAENLPSLQLGQTVPRLARVQPTPTPKDVWNTKFDRYLRALNSGISAISSDMTALKADLEATYQAGFIN